MICDNNATFYLDATREGIPANHEFRIQNDEFYI